MNQAVRGWNYKHREQQCRDHSADHWSGDPPHDLRSRAAPPHDGQESRDDHGNRHGHRAYAKGGALDNRLIKLAPIIQSSACAASRYRLVQVHQHDNANLCRNAAESNESHRRSDRHVVAEKEHQPVAPDKGKGEGRHNERRVAETTKRQVQQHEDNAERGRHDEFESLGGPRQILELTGPGDGVAGR